MATQPEHETELQTQEIFVRADEVDAGTTIVSAGTQQPLSALSSADGTNADTTRPKPPPRPALRRDGSGPPPPPPSQPPPAPPVQLGAATDSLSLPQLRQLVSQFPKQEQQAYAYEYRDAEDYAVEVDEWFHYTELEQDREYLLAAREAFEQRWRLFCQSKLDREDASWTAIDHRHRRDFVSSLVSDLKTRDGDARHEALASVYYVLAGVWSVNAGLDPVQERDEEQYAQERYNSVQIEWMHKGADLAVQCGAVSAIYDCLRSDVEAAQKASEAQEAMEEPVEPVFDDSQVREVSLCFSCLYLLAESSRSRLLPNKKCLVREALMDLEPNFLAYLVSVISRLRWNELYNIPRMHALHLLWKLVLLFFGDIKTHLDRVKGILQPRSDPFSSEAAHPILTASPLDYHLFRQEVTSKYPAYNPPPPLIPLEIEQKTMLPPPLNTSRAETYDPFASPDNILGGGGSILHQPVHIATPAPSPPPSPVGPGGKAGKKQNYQTNQNFPFLYPPLDSGSNNIGGKGSTEFQDAMVGKKWEGSHIPASIIEAGELFASRMRMTRAMRQLWTERDLFMKYERGWNESGQTASEKYNRAKTSAGLDDDDELNDPDLQERMDAVNEFFHSALPDLQSLVIVMMKEMLDNVQDIALRNGNMQDGQNQGLNRSKSNPNLAQNQSLPMPPPPPQPNEMSLEELDNIRSREISQKAISGTLFLMLKWFKISHVLKFEYMTQLLLDSNYVQLTLKYFAHQNLEDLVAFKYDREDLSFWHYCHIHSDHPPLSPTSPDSQPQSDTSSIDDAVPPPIQRHRRSPTTNSEGHPNTSPNPNTNMMSTLSLVQSPEQSQTLISGVNSQGAPPHPSVDELGNPLAPLPSTPITTFSPRQFQTSIHLLRLLQKLTRSKSHRILLLVQFKSSQILRRVLRVPDPMLRLYVLKLFKGQVPYCGRKWRQSNMRVITAIYLHCRPELRDEWLAGMHDTNVEGEVDEAVPLEWALRGLTYWWMKRMFPDVMRLKQTRNKERKPGTSGDEEYKEKKEDEFEDLEGGQEVEDDERDFFQRELDAMGWGMAALGVGEDVGFGEEAPGAAHGMPNTANGVNGDHSQFQQLWENPGPNMQTGASGGGTGGMEMW